MNQQTTAAQKIFNLIILDESGSMESIRDSTIRSFNELVQTMRAAEAESVLEGSPQQHFVNLCVFNTTGIREILFHAPVREVKPLNKESYMPNAGTPLFDAMGFSLLKHEQAIRHMTGAVTLVTILTDGEENSSKEYNGQAIRALVARLKEQGWVFTYIGTDHDVTGFAGRMGIHASMSYHKSEEGMMYMMAAERSSRMSFYKKTMSRDYDPKKANQDYFDTPPETPEKKK